MFPDLEPLECAEDLIFALGRSGGLLDPRISRGGAGDTAHGAAGWPFFGQFIAHDITADRSPLGKRADLSLIHNFRTPRANLECVYDAGTGTPFLYERDDPARLLIGINDRGAPDDVPRNQQGVALVGDARSNDVHLFISQLHLAFLRVHNGIVGRMRKDGAAEEVVFEEARRATTWHYQWVIVHDFLPRLVGGDLMRDLQRHGPRFYTPEAEPFIPLEFADAAYRYGHAQIRDTYAVREGAPAAPIFPDLMGFRPVPAERVVDWAYLFDLPGRTAHQHAKRIDAQLAASLIDLPLQITGQVDVVEYHSLAVRDLQRGQALGLPSGESIARVMNVEPLTAQQTGLRVLGWERETPLWYYILKEAEVHTGGERLGPVGGRIVAEALLGIIDADPESYRSVDPGWRPSLPHHGEAFGLGDLLAFADSVRVGKQAGA
jgi:Animal haem peroxidase